MKNFILAAVLALAVVPAYAQAAPDAKADVKTAAAQQPSNEKTLYSLGYFLGNNLKTQLVLENEDDFKAISQGLRDSLLNRSSQTDLETYKPLVIKKYEGDAQKILAKRQAKQAEFLKEIKKDKKSKTLKNGAVIQTVKKGKGKAPKATDIVKVHYEGTLTDGTVFDSSIKRGQPAQFPLNGVISCWTEALQEMNTGGKAKLFCPADTAYGNAQTGAIPAGSLLVFEVELLDIAN